MDITPCLLLVLVIPGLNTDNTSTDHRASVCAGIEIYDYCDGVKNCPDGSDETREACDFVSITRCPPSAFQCAYGACINRSERCNGHSDCADGSDEVNCPSTGSTLVSDLHINTGQNTSPIHGRFKRQSSVCPEIEIYDYCDGVKNCADGSDETRTACDIVSITSCPSTSFQCAYGACINKNKRCDRNNDCADSSDETDCPFQPPARPISNFGTIYNNSLAVIPPVEYSGCRRGESRCKNGQCVDKYNFCDGIQDCADRSDETVAACSEVNKGLGCRKGQWQCRYGACLRAVQRCDQNVDCWDGSDEANCPPRPGQTVNPTSPTNTIYTPPVYTPPVYTPPVNTRPVVTNTPEEVPRGKSCQVPVNADNRQFSTYFTELTDVRPGTFISHKGLLVVQCAQGYQFRTEIGIQFLTDCTDGRWTNDIPECQKLCPSLTSTTVTTVCSPQKCDRPLLPGTKVDFKCKQFYVFSSSGSYGNKPKSIFCRKDGTWSGPEPECQPGCGKSNLHVHSVPTIANGEIPKLGNFPWHAGLYLLQGDQWAASCGGTLISLNVVLTAAHCVANSSRVEVTYFNKENMRVMLGKFYRDWNMQNDGEQFEIKDVYTHPHYRGGPRQYGNDIALLVLDRPAELNDYIMPACVDYENSYALQVAYDKTLLGYIAGWGNTEECSSFGAQCESASETLLYTRLQIISTQECYRITQTISPDPNSRVTEDKYCAGNGKSSVVQQGDSGGGHTVSVNGQYYVFGVVSIKLVADTSSGTSPGYVYAGFTNVSFHMSWLSDTMSRLTHNQQNRIGFH